MIRVPNSIALTSILLFICKSLNFQLSSAFINYSKQKTMVAFSMVKQIKDDQPILKSDNRKSSFKSKSKPVVSKAYNRIKSKTLPKRLTREEETELTTIVHQGARLNQIKTENPNISRSEWAKVAGLDSPATLRRLISSYRRAKNKLVTSNMGLVYSIIRNGGYLSKRGVTEEELVQEGSLGLMRAAELFDPSKGHRFSTYASVWIKGSLGNTKVDHLITIPDREKNKWNKIQRARTDLLLLKGYVEEPTTAEIAKMVDMPVKDVENLQRKMSLTKNLLSLDFEYEGKSNSGVTDGKVSLYDKSLSTNDNSEVLSLREDILSAISKSLDERERLIMGLRYGLQDGKTRSIVECAAEVGLSRARVQQIAASSLRKLRDSEDSIILKEYLLA